MSRMKVKKLIISEKCCLSLDKQFILPFNRIEIIEGYKTIKILNIERINDRIKIYGVVKIQLIYKVKGMEQGLHTFSMPLKFYHNCIIKEIHGKIYPNIKGEFEKVLFTIKGSGKLDIKIGINLKINIFEVEELSFLTGNSINIRGNRHLMNINDILELKDEEIILREYIHLPQYKPLIKKIIDINGKLYILDKSINQKKIMIKGLIELDIIYETIDFNQPVEVFSYIQEFSHFIEIENNSEGLLFFLNYNNPNIRVDDSNGEGLTITSKADIGVFICRQKEVSIVTKLPEIIGGIKERTLLTEYPLIQKIDRMHLENIVCEGKSGLFIKELLQGKIKYGYISSALIMDESIYIRGRLILHIEYIGWERESIGCDQGVKVFQTDHYVDFDRVITIEGIKSDMNVEASVLVQDQKLDLIQQGEEIMVVADLKLITRVSKLMEIVILVRE